MTRLRLHSLAFRATFWILLLVAAVGLLSLWLGSTLTVERESLRAQSKLQELLDTVERSASIACFLGDKELATEVAQGLLSNRIIKRVVIYDHSKPLAALQRAADPDAGRTAEVPSTGILREVYSPFDPTELAGRIELTPDEAEIAQSVTEGSWFIGALLFIQILAVGLAVLAVVYGFVTRPMTTLAGRLRRLPAERGEKLAHISGHDRDEIGELVGYVNHLIERLFRLLDEERGLRLAREIEERKLRSIFEHAATGIFLIDARGNLLSCNPAFHDMLAEVVPSSRSARFNIPVLFENDFERVRGLISSCDAQDRPVQQDMKLWAADGKSSRWLHLTLSKIENDLYQGVINDITERKQAEHSALESAMTDPLTGLLNRRGLEAKVAERLEGGLRSSDTPLALMLMDLDRFKGVNDTYGHDAGDRVLVEVGNLLRRQVRKTDLVGRMGGDEFLILVTSFSSSESLERIAGKIIERVSRPIDIGAGRKARIGASIGISISRQSAFDYDRMIKRADEAMYEAKKAGRGTLCLYERVPRPLLANSRSA